MSRRRAPLPRAADERRHRCYDDPAAAPTRDFLASSWSAAHDFTAETDTWTYADRFLSDRIVIYRCVPVGP